VINPFSNLRLLERALEGIEAHYGAGEVLVDSKFAHSLRRTDIRLIVPENRRAMHRTGTDDDTWSAGIQLKNSLIGDVQTSIDGYLFRRGRGRGRGRPPPRPRWASTRTAQWR
jgi:hypothetical protein